MPNDVRSYHLLAWEDDAGEQHVMRVRRSETNTRLMALHAALVAHGFQPVIFEPVEWTSEQGAA